MIQRLTIILLPFLLLLSCTDASHDNRLERIAGTVSEEPREALASLDSINPASLSTSDRHYYDFLTVKARDKAYIKHESDSLILSLINYYSSSSGQKFYPEILYYGGRVYSDLGDYPTALSYFHDALEQLPNTPENLKLRKTILSQTGRLLNKLRIFDQAVPYLKESVDIADQTNDSTNFINNSMLLADIYTSLEKYDSAICRIRAARNIAEKAGPDILSAIDLQLAVVDYEKGNIASALARIRPLAGRVHPSFHNLSLAYASKIYRASGMPDSARLFAEQLIHDPDPNNKRTGYEVLLSPTVKQRIARDSIVKYAEDYSSLTEQYLNTHEAQSALIQNAYYNYSKHLREKEKAEKRNSVFLRLTMLAIIAIILLVIFVLILRQRQSRTLLRLHEAIVNIDRLQIMIQDKKHQYTDNHASPDADGLKKTLVEKLRALSNAGRKAVACDNSILTSPIYEQIRCLLSSCDPIHADNPLWEEIESMVLKSSPNFKTKMQLLGGSELKDDEYHLGLLIKCGFTPTETISLLGKSKGSLSYWRKTLGQRILNEDLDLRSLDNIIRLL